MNSTYDAGDSPTGSGVVAIVIHYGEAALTAMAIHSIADGSTTPDSIIVVDNGPGTLTAADLHAAARTVPLELITQGTNLGFAGGVQLAMRTSAVSGADAVWLLNNDATAGRDALEALLAAMRGAGRRALVSSRILGMDGGIWFQDARFYPWLGVARHPRRSAPGSRLKTDAFGSRTSWFSVPYLPACSLLVPHEFTESVGNVDPAFFVYGEDIDLSIRAMRAGWGLLVADESVVVHASSSSTSRNARERMQAATSLRVTARYFPLLTPVAVAGSAFIGVVRGIRARDIRLTAGRLGGLADELRLMLSRRGR